MRCVDRSPTVLPMSERRLFVAVIGVLAAALGVAMMLLSLLALRHPVASTGEIGTATDFTPLLIDLIWLGGLVVVVGFGTAALLVRSQLRSGRARR